MRVPSVRDAAGLHSVMCPVCTPWGAPSPLFFVTAHSKGVMTWLSVSADSKGLICTKIVHNLLVPGTAHSKDLSR
jgi:hypothetical protein